MAAIDLIEGKNAVIEALRAGMTLDWIELARNIDDRKGVDEIRKRAAKAGITLREVDRATLDERSERGAHQGVQAKTGPFPFSTLGSLLKAAEGKERALIIALDHITDPGNLGAIARSAEVVGATGILVPSRRSASLTPAAHKAAAGALARIPVAQETNLVRSLKRCKDEGFWVAGASEHADQLVWDAPLEGRIVLVMGSEGEGLARLTQEHCDFLVKLPQVGHIGSLNVAQATTALAYEWARRAHEADRG